VTTRSLFPSPTSGDETFIEGEVARVTFENNETGFRVLKLTVNGRSERLTVVGTLPPLSVGAHVRVRGKLVTDSRHGEQLRAEGLTEIAPSTAKGIERYLASGAVAGVGEKLAARIVEAFGDDTLRILDEEPERLAAIAGVGKKRAERLLATWGARRAERDVLVFLQAHGATAALAARIAKRYGANAIAVVKKDPYRLALDVAGIGFKTADRMAHGLGIARDSPERAQAGILQALRDETEAGHVYSPSTALRRRASALLDLPGELELGHAIGEGPTSPDELLARALHALAEAGHVIVEADSLRDDLVYLPRMYAAERRLAERTRELAEAEVRPLPGAAAAVAAFEKGSMVSLADEQRDAVFEAARASLFIVTGGPGVGKTTVLKAILAVFRASGLVVRLAAPTGRAAKRMTAATSVEATTIHRLLEFDPQRGGSFKRNAQQPLEAGAIIIDEASMVDLPLADCLFQAIHPGTRVVFVGDVGQLPSIGPGAVLRDFIASKVAPCVMLKHIFRQAAQSQIVVNAHRIHDGLPPLVSPPAPTGDAEAPLSDFFVIERRDAESATRTITELVSSRIPRRFGLDPIRDIQVLTPMHRGAAGSHAINLALQAALNPRGAPLFRGQRELRVGDKVMQLKNDYDRTVWNGDIGVVASVDAQAGSLVVRFEDEVVSAPGDIANGRLVPYEPSALDNLTLAYACSVHKAQGSEYPAVVIPLLTSHFVMLSLNLLYTAITRGKRLVVLVADPRAIGLALAEARRDDRHTRLAERIAGRGSSSLRHPTPLTDTAGPSTLSRT
jgi:exodeoxyribonuclease V alpha subunit